MTLFSTCPDDKLKSIESYDLIVPFFSPQFKTVVENRVLYPKSDLVKEYDRINERFIQDPFSIFPALLNKCLVKATDFSR